MADRGLQKQKLLWLVKILYENTDDEHGLSQREICALLRDKGIFVERKTFYSDIKTLIDFGIDVVKVKEGRNTFYHMGSREFELAEVKLLVDLVQSSKFITDKKSRSLIGKLEKLTGVHEAKELQRQVIVAGRIKSENESIYYTVDTFHDAINRDVSVTFNYSQWNMQKKCELRHDGKLYTVSPWALSWSEGNYYLIGFDNDSREIRHYRVDKIVKLNLTENQRQGRKAFGQFDIASYTKRLFGMFGGEEKQVSLIAENNMVGILIDYLGRDIPINPIDADCFETEVSVVPSNQFLGWILSLGNGIKITGPEEVVENMAKMLEERMEVSKDKMKKPSRAFSRTHCATGEPATSNYSYLNS